MKTKTETAEADTKATREKRAEMTADMTKSLKQQNLQVEQNESN